MEKRAVIFVVISLIVLFGYMQIVQKFGLLPELPGLEEYAQEEAKKTPGKPADIPSAAPAGSDAIPGDAVVEANGLIEIPVIETVIENNLYSALLSNKGGVITSWILKDYGADTNGERVNLLNPSQGPKQIFPLTVLSNGEDFSPLPCVSDGGNALLTPNNPTAALVFYCENGGKKIKKTLTFHYDSYQVGIDVESEGFEKGFDMALGTNFGAFDLESGSHLNIVGPVAMVDDEMTKFKLPKLEQKETHYGEIMWVAHQDKYFISAFKTVPDPSEKKSGSFTIDKIDDKHATVSIHAEGKSKFLLFAGPKKKDDLKAAGLEPVLDLGWFIFGTWSVVDFFAQILFVMLKFFYSLTGNYGIAIIILTTTLKVLFFPLTHKSFVSMKSMQAVQPKMKALQEKHKDDKQKLNLEIIKLYKEHNVNPMSGCLPILMQLPVFIALYNILFISIELRHAPFMLWMNDLSVKDPYYVLPIIMGITMVYQQKIQPSQMDPMQAKIMLLMPVVFTFMFLNFPSGLVLYWLVNNVLTIAQQLITQKIIEKKSLAVIVAK